jgi:NAD(P)-dependent dehydrogenase (short-subunit alcohol dehydrogenase family)
MMARLAGRTALVTGSTSGIGRSIAEAFAAEGASVIVSGRRHELGQQVVKEIRTRGGAASFVGVDLADADAIAEFASAVTAAAPGPIDILVNNAAYLLGATATVDTTIEMIDAALAVNVAAPIVLTALLVPGMIAAGRAAIVNIGSINASAGMPGAALYSATKGALESMTRAWAAEFGRLGVRVNAIAPGPTETEWNEPLRDYLTTMVAGTPGGRLSRGHDVAAAAVFLASDDAANIHGATLAVDGGMSTVAFAATA